MWRLLVLPCDGIGPEITLAAVKVLQRATAIHRLSIVFHYDLVGFDSLQRYGSTLRTEVLERAREYDGIILGTQAHAQYPPPEQGGRNVSAGFRIGLDLYANCRPVKTYAGVTSNMRTGKTMDLVIMREATEGFYPDRNMFHGWGEWMPSPDMALSMRKITRMGCERIARKAFQLAEERRQKVTAVHKVNSFHVTDGLFMECVRKVAQEFPTVALDDLLVDAAAAHLVRTPERFDVLVTTNLYGDILSDLASELSGSLGLGAAVMMSDTHCCAQAQHGSAPDIAGKDQANPTSMILSTSMLLRWLGRKHSAPYLLDAARSIDQAVITALANPVNHTADLGGHNSCSGFTDAVVALLK